MVGRTSSARSAAQLLVECLEVEGVQHVFGIPGEETLDLNEALDRSSIAFIPVRHEQGAAFMADAQGRLTGRAGVCLGTLGPGATNLVTGIADANLDRAPLVALTGQTSLAEMHKDSHQYVDIVRMFAPVTKWNTRVHDPEIVPEVVRKAFLVAQREKPGATHLELPADVMAQPVSGVPLPQREEPVRRPGERELELVADMIATATRPVILAGNGVIRQRASASLRALVHDTGLPVVTTFMGKGVIAADDPLATFTAGLRAADYREGLLGEADLVVCIGYDLVEWSPQSWNDVDAKTVVSIDTVRSEVDRDYLPSVELVGDIGPTLDRLRERLQDRPVARPPLRPYPDFLRDALAVDDTFPLKPQRVLRELRGILRPHDLLISDVGAHKLWISRLWPTYEPDALLISNGLASMGFALPAAIGARLVLPDDRAVVTISGDGGFLMNVQELETAVRLGTRIVNLVWVDGAYGVIELHQQRRFGRTAGTRFTNPDLVTLAQSFGAAGMRVGPADDLRSVLFGALAHPGPSVVEIPIDYSDNRFLGADIATLAALG